MNSTIEYLNKVIDKAQEMREEGEHDMRTIIYTVETMIKEIKSKESES